MIRFRNFINKPVICYAFLLTGLLCSCGNKNICVGIQPFDNFERSYTDTVALTLGKLFDARCIVLPSKPIPEKAFVNTKVPRYRADEIIRILATEKPGSLDYIVGLTTKDISTTKKDRYGNVLKPERRYADWGIFGLAFKSGPSCVISSFRLRNTSEPRVIERIKKIAAHELGHTLGLDHCESTVCVMRDAAEKIQTIDDVNISLCDTCKKQSRLKAY